MDGNTIAHELAKSQKSISVAEFFEKNRHLLGFDSPIKAILTCVKEAVDNSLDASEEVIFELKRRALKYYKEIQKLKDKNSERAKKLKEKISNLKKEIIHALPDIEVRISEAQEEFRIVDKSNTRRGAISIRKDGKNIIRIDDKEIKFERQRVSNFKLKDKEFEISASKNNKGEYEIEYIVKDLKEKFIAKKTTTTRYIVSVQDNGPGIVPEQIPKIFCKLLYGSKFQSLGGGKQSRGQQGIGISAAVLYGQLTTGRPAYVVSRISPRDPAVYYKLLIDTLHNSPEIIEKGFDDDFTLEHGTRIEIELEGTYLSSGEKSIFEFLRLTSIANPYAKITFIDPTGKKTIFQRTTEKPPKEPLKVKAHPHGIEIGTLQRMCKNTDKRSLLSFLTQDFSRIGASKAKEIIKKAKLNPKMKPSELTRAQVEALLKKIQSTNIMKPPTDCLSPIDHDAIIKELKAEFEPEFVTAVTREPEVYRGMPFQIEAAIAYGGNLKDETRLIRFANKVPLMYGRGGCAITKAVSDLDWRRYSLSQSGGRGLPQGRIAILVHICSVWVPFTSESKSAIASYPIILKEIKLALQECARQLNNYLRRRHREQRKKQRINIFVKYSTELVLALSRLTGKNEKEVEKIMKECLIKRYGDDYVNR